MFKAPILFISFVLFTSYTNAFQFKAFKCNVLDTVGVNKDGRLDDKSGWVHLYKGKEFIVDRETGRVLGKIINNFDVNYSPEVISKGSSKVPFKAINLYNKSYDHISYLQVDTRFDYHPYPFHFYTERGFVTGTCVRY